MIRIKKLLADGVIVYSLLIGLFIILMATNNYFLSFVEKATEMEFNPLCFQEWILVLLRS
ncbi:MAG: hypothetical protein KAT34_15665 [Candidatus Aminicenantes bacterium]|jgi:hypothetical protein|nr:hypothetical protein [Candidatus Aminicenantes bacterium]